MTTTTRREWVDALQSLQDAYKRKGKTMHRLVGTVQHRAGTYSWQCLCGAFGAARFAKQDSAREDWKLHLRSAT
ncbi:MAG: hypothetical protein GY906_29265 [bacterium]|nr:hypothetical protein [bacterium]